MSIPHIKRIVTFCSIGMCLLAIWLSKPTQTQSDTMPSVSTQKQDPAAPASEQDNSIPRQTYTFDQASRFQDTEFYRTIIDNNIFRPIGWRPPRKKETYRLIGTILPRGGKSKAQAILQKNSVRRTYIVMIGDQLDADTTVIDIQTKQVTLEKAGQQRTLTLNTTPWLK